MAATLQDRRPREPAIPLTAGDNPSDVKFLSRERNFTSEGAAGGGGAGRPGGRGARLGAGSGAGLLRGGGDEWGAGDLGVEELAADVDLDRGAGVDRGVEVGHGDAGLQGRR